MNDEQLRERVLGYVEEGMTRLVLGADRANLEAFLRGEAVFIVSRTEAVVALPPPQIRTDLGEGN